MPEIAIDGARLVELESHPDDRGTFTEVFREEWGVGIEPVQWNVSRSKGGVLRGVHVHPVHADYLVFVAGRATLGLRDLRPGSATEGAAVTFEVSADGPIGVVVPPGVAHGFYHHDDGILLVGVDAHFDPADELGCRWDDPGLGIDWQVSDPQISRRDAELPTLPELRQEFEGTRG